MQRTSSDRSNRAMTGPALRLRLGRWSLYGPAVLASVLAFLAYDFFFVPPKSEIRIDVTSETTRALIRVHNVGPAIPREEQDRVFETFQRVQRRGYRDTRGAGLGLAISKGIVEAHGGSIWTQNEDGGVAFYVALPLANAGTTVHAEASTA